MIAACLVAATAVMLVACGDTEEKNDYVDAVNNVTSTLNTGLTDVSAQANAADSPDQIADVFSQFATQLDTATKDLDEITPPEGVDDLHEKLVGELEELTAAANTAADGVSAGGASGVVTTAQQFVAEATRISAEADATISQINSELQN